MSSKADHFFNIRKLARVKTISQKLVLYSFSYKSFIIKFSFGLIRIKVIFLSWKETTQLRNVFIPSFTSQIYIKFRLISRIYDLNLPCSVHLYKCLPYVFSLPLALLTKRHFILRENTKLCTVKHLELIKSFWTFSGTPFVLQLVLYPWDFCLCQRF